MMDDKQLTETVESLKKDNKRKFSQSYDLIVSLKDLNLKKTEEQVEFFVQVHKTLGKKKKIAALVGPELLEDAKKIFDTTFALADFAKLDKKTVKQAASENDFFIGQANIMPKVAQTWGRVLGPRNKMPNPKAGAIVPPKAPLQPIYDKFQKTVRISAKKSPNIQVMVGTQQMETKDIVDNIKLLYDQIVHHLPRENNNIKAAYLKLTMSKPIKIH